MLTDFQNSFTGRLTGKFATNAYLNIPPHLKYVATLQGSVATRLRCGGIFKYELVANLPVSLPVKEF